MQNDQFPIEDLDVTNVLAPGADALAGTKTTGPVDMKNIKAGLFHIHVTGGTTGKSTVTLEKSADSAFTTPVAIAYKYKKSTANDAYGSLTAATADGVDTATGNDKGMVVAVTRKMLGQGYRYVRLKLVEAADDPVNAAITFVAAGPRFSGRMDIE